MRCPSDNTQKVDQSDFWSPGGWYWDTHRTGWTVAGVFTLLTLFISGLHILAHVRNYTVRKQQRQIIRILFMPPVYAIISFLSYRFFRDYVYYSLIESVYESITIGAFLLLLIEFVADAARKHDRTSLLAEKEKRRMLFPLCYWRYRPTKEYFMHAVKWSVLQYVFVRPAITLIAIICQASGVLCESQSYNFHFASVYLDAIDFVSVSVALYGLLLFYNLTNEDLRGRRPLAKFLAIKMLVFLTFYQVFIFDALENRVIHGTAYWTATNIANGLNALTVCIEMILFSAFMWWAYPVGEYSRKAYSPPTPIGRALLDCFNYSDFLEEGKMSVRYFVSKGPQRELARMPRRDVGNLDIISWKYSTNSSDLDALGAPLPPGYFDAQEIPPAYFQ
ncbi:organic solute transporter Ostalpha-domain-containing protein [Amanita rubescens]|nr:organic solute transporter Ostalpha-domain-containing protein [Amanita rubescens]